jgi:hypothetical protein
MVLAAESTESSEISSLWMVLSLLCTEYSIVVPKRAGVKWLIYHVLQVHLAGTLNGNIDSKHTKKII